MNPIWLLIKTYWMQLTALALCLFIVGLIGYQRHEIKALKRDNASLQQTIDLAKALGNAQNEKAQRIEQGAHAAVTLQAQQGQSDLTKIKAYYEAHPVIKRVTVSLRKPATNSDSRQLPSVPAASEVTAASGQDTDAAASGQSLEYQCAVTTSQYNTLYQAWMAGCAESVCK